MDAAGVRTGIGARQSDRIRQGNRAGLESVGSQLAQEIGGLLTRGALVLEL